MSDLDQLREVGVLVRQPGFEELLETRRRRTLRTRIATASALAVAATAVVGVLAVTGGNVRTGPPPVAPSPSPTPTETFEIPAGQQTITPDIRPGDVHGFDVLATVTNSQPEHQGDSELSATVTVHTGSQPISAYCRGASGLWWYYERSGGAMGFGRCSPDADTSLPVGSDLEGDSPNQHTAEPVTVRMWIAHLSAAYVDCFHGNTPDCNAVYGVPQPIVNPDAEFGFRIYEHLTLRPVLQVLDDADNNARYSFEALSSLGGTAWLLDRAVVAGPDADRLALGLSASDDEYLVDVYTVDGPHMQRCAEQHADELPGQEPFGAYLAARDKVCGVALRLVVDGNPVAPDENPYAAGHFTNLGAHLSPGAVHRIVVEVEHGDPRNIRYAVIVRTRTRMP
jgi:hypothetical protein